MNGGRASERAAIGLFALALVAGAALRFPGLGERPMHADEAILADKFGTLLEAGQYRYDLRGYHGPALLYLTLPAAWLAREHTYQDLSEATLRGVTSVAGLLLVAAPLLLAGAVDRLSLGFAALLTAISPTMVFYSRHYIPEMVLTLFVFATVALGLRWPILAGITAGVALATKETAMLAFAGLAVAAGTAIRRVKPGHIAAAAATAAITGALLLSSFFTNIRGATDFVTSYFTTYLPMVSGSGGHVHPWYFYLQVLLTAEPALLVLAAAAMFAAFRSGSNSVWRLLATFALVLAAVYSVFPYKTPWCLLAFWQPAVVAAGFGAAAALRSTRGRLRILVSIALAAMGVGLAVQSWRLSRPLAADPRNPLVYAQTGSDVFLIQKRIIEVTNQHPEGKRLRIQVLTTANWWPLPWYLRAFPSLRWSRGVPEDEPPADVILASPDLEPALARKLYEEPPPGERDLYLHLFPRKVELRPGVEVRGFVRGGVK